MVFSVTWEGPCKALRTARSQDGPPRSTKVHRKQSQQRYATMPQNEKLHHFINTSSIFFNFIYLFIFFLFLSYFYLFIYYYFRSEQSATEPAATASSATRGARRPATAGASPKNWRIVGRKWKKHGKHQRNWDKLALTHNIISNAL